ncbi:MAG: DNA-processing protein DprA [Cyclobacteriaceae bacterium]
MEEKIYQVALELIPGVGSINAKSLISYSGSAQNIFNSPPAKLQKIPGVGPKLIEAIKSQSVISAAETILKDCEKQQIQIKHYTDKDYPDRLKQIADSPNILYTKGEGESNPDRTLAIVGTRNVTQYGKDTTDKIAKSCSDVNATVISGLAYGVDIQAHRTSLTEGIPNIAVLAGGLDKIYPSVHKKVAEQIMENGLLISENPPGIKAEAHFFPARNRIIAGLADATIVVEAAIKGGALITANIADSYDRPVFAVPGDLEHMYSEGCNHLIRNQKAYIYTDMRDVVYQLNWDVETKTQIKKPKDFSHLTEEEQTICQLLQENGKGIAIDEIAWKTQISVNKLASILLALEFQGLLKSLPGSKYQLI